MDLIQDCCSYCNLEELPNALEPFVRKKIKRMIDYETAKGTGYQQDIASIKEGDGSITYATVAVTAVRAYTVCQILIKRYCSVTGG